MDDGVFITPNYDAPLLTPHSLVEGWIRAAEYYQKEWQRYSSSLWQIWLLHFVLSSVSQSAEVAGVITADAFTQCVSLGLLSDPCF